MAEVWQGDRTYVTRFWSIDYYPIDFQERSLMLRKVPESSTVEF